MRQLPCDAVSGPKGELRREESHTGRPEAGALPASAPDSITGVWPRGSREKAGLAVCCPFGWEAGEGLLPSEVGSPEQFKVPRPGAVHGRASQL